MPIRRSEAWGSRRRSGVPDTTYVVIALSFTVIARCLFLFPLDEGDFRLDRVGWPPSSHPRHHYEHRYQTTYSTAHLHNIMHHGVGGRDTLHVDWPKNKIRTTTGHMHSTRSWPNSRLNTGCQHTTRSNHNPRVPDIFLTPRRLLDHCPLT